MKHLATWIAICAILAISLQSCLGSKVDDLALFEPAQLAWPEIEKDYFRGLEDGVSEGDIVLVSADAMRAEAPRMRDALMAKSRDQLRLVPWPTMKPWAQRGIDDALADGDVGPGVADSLREQLQNFDVTVIKLRGGQ